MHKAGLTGDMKATVMRMCGIALLWVGLAAVVYVPTSGGGACIAPVGIGECYHRA